MRGIGRKSISLLLTLVMLLWAGAPAAGADSGAGAGWSDGDEGFAVRIMSYGGDVSRVTAGETFSVEFWISQSNPAVVSVPLSWDPSVVTVVDSSTGEPVKTGRKTESDLVRGAGFRPGEACYDNSLNDDYQPLYWNGKPVYAAGDETGASGYPYINNETGFAKFLYYEAVPTKGSGPQMFLEVYFKSLTAGDPNFHFATAADGNSPEEFDPGSPRGMQVSFSDETDGNIDGIDKIESQTYTNKVFFPDFRVTDGSELDRQPVPPPMGSGADGNAGNAGGGTAEEPTPPTEPEPPAEAVLTAAVKPDRWPYGPPTAECAAQIKRSDESKLYQSDEYVVLDSVLYEASAKAASEVGGVEKTIFVRMPEQIIDKSEYAVSMSAAPLLAMKEADVDLLFLETPYGYLGIDVGAAAEKLKAENVLRVSVDPTVKNAGTKTGTGVGGAAADPRLSGLNVSLQVNGMETTGFSGSALRLLIIYEAKDDTALPVVMTDRAFGYAGAQAPLAVSRYDRNARLLLVQAPAGGKLTIQENQPAAFRDLQSVPWAAEEIGRLSQRNIISGTGAGAFSPEENVTREQFAKMATAALGLYAANPQSPFTDIGKNNPFYSYIASAKSKGIVSGVSAESFDGGGRITREDLAVITCKACDAAGIRLPDVKTAPVFTDDNAIEGYAKDAVYTLVRAGIVSGAGEGRFDPKGSATRAEAARILGAVQEMTDQLLGKGEI